MDLVRIGFIGLGNITQTRHLPAVRRIGGARIMGGADINRALLAQVAERNRFEVSYTDWNQLIESPQIDAVFVNLPTHLHAEVSIAALKAGKHVFCEKPFAMNTREATAMVETAKLTGRSLMISNVQRFAMRSRLMKQHLLRADSKLGEAYYIKSGMLQRNGEPPEQSWFARRERAGGGVLMDQGPGMLDQMLWLLDYPEVDAVNGMVARNVLPDSYNVEDTATVSFRMGGGTMAYLELAWAHSSGPHENLLYTDVYTARGGIRCRASWSNDGPPLTIFRRGDRDQITPEVINFTPVDAHHEQDKHFIDAIRAGRQPDNTPEQALRVMSIIEEVYRQNGRYIEAAAASRVESGSEPSE